MKYDESKLNVLTDHIDMFERSVPMQRWSAIVMLMLTLIVLVIGIWEIKMRSLGLGTGDLDDGKPQWAVERRKVDSGPRDQVVIVGDSRILFDTNLDLWQQLTSVRPIQLAIAGERAGPYFEDIANDEHFAGLVVLGITEGSFFSKAALSVNAILYTRAESLSQRAGHQIQTLLSRHFAFLDSGHSLFTLMNATDLPMRTGAELQEWSARNAARKLGETYEDRQTVMWPRVTADPSTWRAAWSATIAAYSAPLPSGAMPQLPAALASDVIATTKRDIDKIRRRGGEVVIVRPPSTGPFLKLEDMWTPRAQVWDRLVSETHSLGIHFEDYPDMQGLEIPEWSHLSTDSAKKFTRAYVTVICQQLPWLKQHGATCKES